MKYLIALAAAAAALVPAEVQAQNLVVNGGFETGDFSGWTLVGDTDHEFVSGPFYTTPSEGSYQSDYGQVGGTGGISQALATIAGHSYAISFDLYNTGGNYNYFEADFGATTLMSWENAPGTGDFQTHSFNVVASSASTALTLLFRQDPGYWTLDNVSVTDSGSVPEAATWAMMVGGFGAIGAAMRRRSAKLRFA